MDEKREQDPQEQQLGRKPDQKQARIDVFEHNPPTDVPVGESDEAPLPEEFPNEPGFAEPDEQMLTTTRSEDELPNLERDYEKANQERSPDKAPPVRPDGQPRQ